MKNLTGKSCHSVSYLSGIFKKVDKLSCVHSQLYPLQSYTGCTFLLDHITWSAKTVKSGYWKLYCNNITVAYVTKWLLEVILQLLWPM